MRLGRGMGAHPFTCLSQSQYRRGDDEVHEIERSPTRFNLVCGLLSAKAPKRTGAQENRYSRLSQPTECHAITSHLGNPIFVGLRIYGMSPIAPPL
jgi:hypothetical protein